MDDEKRRDGKPVSWQRMAVWLITGALGAYLVLTGIFGILAKG